MKRSLRPGEVLLLVAEGDGLRAFRGQFNGEGPLSDKFAVDVEVKVVATGSLQLERDLMDQLPDERYAVRRLGGDSGGVEARASTPPWIERLPADVEREAPSALLEFDFGIHVDVEAGGERLAIEEVEQTVEHDQSVEEVGDLTDDQQGQAAHGADSIASARIVAERKAAA